MAKRKGANAKKAKITKKPAKKVNTTMLTRAAAAAAKSTKKPTNKVNTTMLTRAAAAAKSTKKPTNKDNTTRLTRAAPAKSTSTPANSNNKRTSQAPPSQPYKKFKGTVSGWSPSPFSTLPASDSTTPYLPSVRTAQYAMKDIVGLDTLKQKIIDYVVDPFVLDEKTAPFLNIKQPKGILLTGPPGCGKTCLADAIVSALKEKGKNVNFYQETGSCLSQWLGESERNIRSLFAFAHANSPAVIFMDEIDGLGFKRDNGRGGNTRITTLLTEMNNVTRGKVLLIAATNCVGQVDQALIRPGRFDKSLEVPLPNAQGRAQILQHYVAKKKMQVKAEDLQRIVQDSENWSGAKLETFVDDLYVSRLKNACPNYATMSLGRLKTAMPNVLKVDLAKDILPLLAEMRGN